MPLSRRQLLLAAAVAAAAGCGGPGPAARDEGGTDAGGATAAGTSTPPAASPAARDASPSASASSPSGAPGRPRRWSPAAELVHGSRTASAVALTFHGAGDPALARAALRELEQAHVRATVLVVGTWLDDEPAMARRVLDGGHELGNHTQHHLPMRGLGVAAAHREIVGCAQSLQRLTGSPGRWFRASGTQHTTRAIRVAAGRAGYEQCLSYDVDSLDWTDPGSDAIVRRVLAAARGGSIVSLHLGHSGTVRALPVLVDALRARGLRTQSVSELVR